MPAKQPFPPTSTELCPRRCRAGSSRSAATSGESNCNKTLRPHRSKNRARVLRVLCFLLVVSFHGHAALARDNEPSCDRKPEKMPVNWSELIPGVSLDAWRILVGQPWSEGDDSRPGWFDADALVAASRLVPRDQGYHAVEAEDGHYVPLAPTTPRQDAEYAATAWVFHGSKPEHAVALFDALASLDSPYAAAAAYSAARATFDGGDVEGGIRRIGRLLADPGKAEMHGAAHDLIGTMAYDTGAAPLLAARLVEITHLLAAPLDLRCRSAELQGLHEAALDDLRYLLNQAYPTDHRNFGLDATPRLQDVLGRIAPSQPLIDVAQVLAIPTSFSTGRSWLDPYRPDGVRYPGFELQDQEIAAKSAASGARLVLHARERAQATDNPLWAYAVAVHTTAMADLPLIRSARLSLSRALVNDADREALDGWLLVQEARIELMNGHEDVALALLKDEALRWSTPPDGRPNDFGSFIIDGGTRYLLARRDLAGARRWSTETSKRFPGLLDPERYRMILAAEWSEALEFATLRDPMGGENSSPALASMLDLQPADRLVALARTPDLTPTWRRAILSAAWTRYYALDRQAAFRALFPEMRLAFPELVDNLDGIEAAWMPWTRRRLVTRMLLRLPGLSPRVLWARPPHSMYEARPSSLSAIDQFNPNDGNWWCPIDPQRAQRDAFAQVFAEEWWSDIYPDVKNIASFSLYGDVGDVNSIVHDWIVWDPLTRNADLSELRQLSKVASGPARLANDAVAWARQSSPLTRWLGLDRDLPETLALAVRASRYGCRRDGRLGSVSKEAWKALHDMFPASAWAAQTPYWFDEHTP